MATWTQFSPEITAEREICRSMRRSALCKPKNFKGQALREMALRMNADDDISQAKRQIVNLTTALEEARQENANLNSRLERIA